MKKIKGFTLIELMIVVLIVGVLGSFALNSYSKSTMKSKRADAKSKLMEIMQKEEKYFSENNTYYIITPVTTAAGDYAITVAANASGLSDGILITATPLSSQLNDSECGSFILNSNGQKTTSTGSTSCW